MRISLVLLFFSTSLIANSQNTLDFRVGPELTFTNNLIKEAFRAMNKKNLGYSSQIATSETSKKFSTLLIKKILSKCNTCKTEVLRDQFKQERGLAIIFENNFKIFVTLDPSVIEIQTSPIDYNNLNEATQILNDKIYNSAKEIGIGPSYAMGGGHIHLGAKGLFTEDPELLRDFLVDLYNHPEISLEILGDLSSDDPTIHALPSKNKKAFYSLIDQFDKMNMSTNDFVYLMHQTVYNQTLNSFLNNGSSKYKFQAINLLRMDESISKTAINEQTLELRFLRTQKSAEQFRLTVELFKKRLEFLKSRRTRGVFEKPIHMSINKAIKLSKSQGFERFITYLEEMNEPPKKYLRLLPHHHFENAWKYLKTNYPNDLDVLKKFLKEISFDAPYDSIENAKFILKKANRFKGSFKSELIKILDIRAKGSLEDKKLQEVIKRNNTFFNTIKNEASVFIKSCKEWLEKN